MKSRLLAFASFCALPTLALAHPGHDGDHDFGWDFTGGFTHPLFGWDHLLAMVTVGLWAARLGGRARYLLPGAFMSALVLGALASRLGFQAQGVEHAIASSLILLGLGFAFAPRVSVALAAPAVAVLAFAHGLAHGAEAPIHSNVWMYIAGFVVSTALLHAAGVLVGQVLHSREKVQQALGTGIALAGVVALVA